MVHVAASNLSHTAPWDVMRDQCEAMIRFAARRGRPLPVDAVEVVHAWRDGRLTAESPEALSDLVAAHAQLTEAVAPATPETIELLDTDAHRWWHFLGPVSYVRWLMVLAIVCVIGLVAFQSAATTGDRSWAEVPAVTFAAAVGALFFVLTAVYRALDNGSFSVTDEGDYSLTLVLGVLAGTAIALAVPVGGALGDAGVNLSRPLVAVLGGFSGDAVHRILGRLVETLEALVSGPPNEAITAQERALARSQAVAEIRAARIDLAGRLTTIRSLEGSRAMGAAVEELTAELLRDPGAPRPVPVLAEETGNGKGPDSTATGVGGA